MSAQQKKSAKQYAHSLYLFIRLLKGQKWKVLFVIFACLVGSVLYTVQPWFMGNAIDNIAALIAENDFADIDFSMEMTAILKPIILILIAAALSWVFSYIAERIMADVSEQTALQLRKQVSHKLTRLPLRFYDQTKVGELLSMTSTDIDKISEILVIGFNQFMLAFFDLICGVAIMLYISPLLTVIVLAVLVVSFAATYFISRANQKASDKNLATLAEYNAISEELYSGAVLIKAFNTQEASEEKIREANEKQYKAHLKAQFMNYVIYPVIRIINQAAFIISALAGAIMVIQGNMTLGVVQAYLQYVSQVSEPVTQFSFVVNYLQAALAAVERVSEILDAEEESPEPENPVVLDQPKGEIEFRHVSFGYLPGKTLMKDVSFTAKANQTIAVVGPTGAGKTTLVNLLMRFYEVNGGQILFDGKSTQGMTRQYLRSLLGMVLQDTWLFKGTVAENIAYGKKDATHEEIVAAAQLAQCDSFIRTLPDGYDTVISSEQSVLSQGQQQLLTIARAALANPNVMILDEATSSIDTITEQRIQKALAELMKNRTSFIIAHRLSTIRNADLILVMREGDIIETGTHEELLSWDSFYSKLYRAK